MISIAVNENTENTVINLFKAISSLDSAEEVSEFFEDLCTKRELIDMAQRFDTAVKLYNGENYLNVSSKTGISSATISRVNKCLKRKGGYVKTIEKLGLKNTD
ncbi:MAG: DNA-binding transcriptional regulator [Clostridia bacterium]|nr:DNA-binding transcriptional regulator [Clostridia bacterium]